MTIRATVYTTASISENQDLTPEGFLLCRDVAVARTGMMIYGKDETPVPADSRGIVKIYRDEETVFSKETIASAIGKPVTIDHPEDDVTPDTWKDEAVGVAINVRRGEGNKDDLLLMDLLIQAKEGIEAIQEGLREISLGYEADYEYDEQYPGIGRQKNIIINHVALVEKGRCGSRCAIKDKKLDEKQQMSKNNKKGMAKFMDLLFRAKNVTNDDEMESITREAMDEFGAEEHEGEEKNIHIHINPTSDPKGKEDMGGRAFFTDDDIKEHIDNNAKEHAEFKQRLDAIEAMLSKKSDDDKITDDDDDYKEESEDDKMEASDDDIKKFLGDEAPEGIDPKEAVKAKDSQFLKQSFRDTVALAEIIAPGIKIPTYDRANKPVKTALAICKLRKSALDSAYAGSSRYIIEDLMNGKDLDTKRMTCDAVRHLFNATASMKRMENNNKNTRDSLPNGFQGEEKTIMTIEDINKLNEQYYSKGKK